MKAFRLINQKYKDLRKSLTNQTEIKEKEK